jgi:hypothetical protein
MRSDRLRHESLSDGWSKTSLIRRLVRNSLSATSQIGLVRASVPEGDVSLRPHQVPDAGVGDDIDLRQGRLFAEVFQDGRQDIGRHRVRDGDPNLPLPAVETVDPRPGRKKGPIGKLVVLGANGRTGMHVLRDAGIDVIVARCGADRWSRDNSSLQARCPAREWILGFAPQPRALSSGRRHRHMVGPSRPWRARSRRAESRSGDDRYPAIHARQDRQYLPKCHMIAKMKSACLSHPRAPEESCLQHMAFAAGLAAILLLAGLAALDHAVFPFLLERTASRMIADPRGGTPRWSSRSGPVSFLRDRPDACAQAGSCAYCGTGEKLADRIATQVRGTGNETFESACGAALHADRLYGILRRRCGL